MWFATGASKHESLVFKITNYKVPVIMKWYKDFSPYVETFLKNETIA